LFVKIASTKSIANPEVVSFDNPTKSNPSLILMETNELGTSTIPLFTHNFHIKHELATLIMDNDSQNNLISQALVQFLQLPTTSHPTHTNLVGYKREALALQFLGVVRSPSPLVCFAI
jgi:hypothetical protein